MKMMKLSETVEMMNSADYKERFKAEYLQLKIRANGLKNMLDKWDNGELNFTPTCPRGIYNDQMEYMTNYMTVLANRAYLEGINLDEQN
jgi:hypothetical protein